MKALSGLLFVFFVPSAFSYDCEKVRNEAKRFAECNCSSPNASFLFSKLRASFAIDEGIKELKEIITEPVNYQQRENVKGLWRQLQYARRRQKPELIRRMTDEFSLMIDQADVRDPIPDFPSKGATSTVTSAEGAIMMTMENLSRDEMSFLPPHILEKIGSSFRIHYYYPIDRFDYNLKYDGDELPLEKALFKIQDEFEVACLERFWENTIIRRANKIERGRRNNGLDGKGSGVEAQ